MDSSLLLDALLLAGKCSCQSYYAREEKNENGTGELGDLGELSALDTVETRVIDDVGCPW